MYVARDWCMHEMLPWACWDSVRNDPAVLGERHRLDPSIVSPLQLVMICTHVACVCVLTESFCVCWVSVCVLVAVVDVDASKAQQVAQELQLKGARSLAIQADVSSKKDCQRWGTAAGLWVSACCELLDH